MTATFAIAIAPADLDDPRIAAIAAAHNAHCEDASAPCANHVLAMDALSALHLAVFAALHDGAPVGIGALSALSAAEGEMKSMHVTASARGLGAGRALLAHIIDVAKARGYRRLWLETGTTPSFAASRTVYERAGFARCGPFAGYPDHADSAFYRLDLGGAA